MIPKDCPLNDKWKLQATLHQDCRYSFQEEEFCKQCPYSKAFKLEKEKAELHRRIREVLHQREFERKQAELREELEKKKFNSDLMRAWERIKKMRKEKMKNDTQNLSDYR